MNTNKVRAGVILQVFACLVTNILQASPVVAEGPAWAASAILSPNGSRILIGHYNGIITCVDSHDGRLLGMWPAQGNNQVEHLEFSADGSRALAVSPNRIIRVLDLGKPDSADLARWILQEYYPGAGLSPDGRNVLMVAHRAPLRWCEVGTGRVLHEFHDPAFPDGYASAVVLDGAGLAVVASRPGGYAALIDAQTGKFLARLASNGGPLQWLHGERTVAQGDVGWSSSLLHTVRSTRPSEPVPPDRKLLPMGWLGHAVRQQLSADQWCFWANAPQTAVGWLEPMWPQLRASFAPNRGQGPIVVDGIGRRLWFHDSRGRFTGWSFSELGKPEALQVPISTGAIETHHQWVALCDGFGHHTIVDPQTMLPIAMRTAAISIGSQPTKEENRTGATWDDAVGWSHGLRTTTTPEGLSVEWIDASGIEKTIRIDGMVSQNPRLFPGPGGFIAVVFGQGFHERIGATYLQRSGLRLWDQVRGAWLQAAFDDHRSAPVADVLWAPNGRWIVSSNFNGYDATRTVWTWSVPEGRRTGPAVDGVMAWAIACNGTLAWSDADGRILARTVADPSPKLITGPGPEFRSARIAISPDSSMIALLSNENLLTVIRLADEHILHRQTLSWWDGGGSAAKGCVAFLDQKTLVVVTAGQEWFRVIHLQEELSSTASGYGT